MTKKLMVFFTDILFRSLFLTSPAYPLDKHRIKTFNDLFELLVSSGNELQFDNQCPYPKYEFLQFIVREKPVLLHGSNQTNIKELVPKEQLDWNGRLMKAIFASSDGIWPMFFAIVDHQQYRGSLRNGCFVIQQEDSIEKRYYFFSLNKDYQHKNPWQEGMIYIVLKEPFQKTGKGRVRFDEWASRLPVKPIGKIKIYPEDFPFLENVSWHSENESMIKSWLFYKYRQKKN